MNSTSRAFNFSTLSCVAGCCHIFPFIAGASKIGARGKYLLEERERIKLAASLAQTFPDLKSLGALLSYFGPRGQSPLSEVKCTFNLAHAKALFRFACPNNECVGGNFDLSTALARAVANSRALSVIGGGDSAVEAGGGVSLLLGQFQKARQLMAPFGLDFAGAQTGGVFPLIGPRIPDSEQVLHGSQASTFSVRAAAERVFPGVPNTLRVIFCPFKSTDERTFGVTDGGAVADWNFPKFCLINVRKANPDQGTILHEIIHAARPEKREHDGDPTSVFSENIGGRSTLPPEHAEALAHAFFGVVLA